MKYNKNVMKSFALVTQLGISMLAPAFLCIFIAVTLEKYFNIKVFIPLMLLGFMAGFRNVYMLVKDTYKDDGHDKE